MSLEPKPKLATLILAKHPLRSKLSGYIEPHLHTPNHPVNRHHRSFHVMHRLVLLANAILVMNRECEEYPIWKKLADIRIRGCKDVRS